eukprot:SAG11_NODE_3384_length_2482_cov_5.328997_4_plen_76_part_01
MKQLSVHPVAERSRHTTVTRRPATACRRNGQVIAWQHAMKSEIGRRYLNIIRGNDLRKRSVKTNELAKILKQVSWW